jgi:Leucine-rich repeat (LRR) protein
VIDTLDLSSSGCTDEVLAALVRCPGAQPVRRLVLDGAPVSATGLRSWAASAGLPNLACLSLRGCPIGDDGALELATLDRPLRHLRLDDCGITATGLTALTWAPWAAGLTTLTLASTQAPSVLQRPGKVIANGGFRSLTSLDLSGTLMTQADLEAFAGGAHLASLTELRLDRALSDSSNAAWILTSTPVSTRLRVLSLADNGQTGQTAICLAYSPHLGQLRCLDLTGNPLDDQGVQALVSSPTLATLQSLRLDTPSLSARTWAAFRTRFPNDRLPPWVVHLLDDSPQVVAGLLDRQAADGNLSISRVCIGPQARTVLINDQRLAAVHTLVLESNQLGDPGAEALAGCPHLAGLRSLTLTDNDISGTGTRALVRSTWLSGLVRLDLSRNPLGVAGLAALADSDLPNLRELVLRNLPGLGQFQPLSDTPALRPLLNMPGLNRLALLDLSDNDISDTERHYWDWSGIGGSSRPADPDCVVLRQRLGHRLRL